MLNHILRPITRGAIQNGRRTYYPVKNWKPVTMDDMPVPSGSWQAQYDKNNKRFNLHLVVGLTSLTAALFTLFNADFIHFNYGPPERGEPLIPPSK